MNQEEQMKKMQRITAKIWMDDGFKQRLLADPGPVLKAEGINIPEGLEVRIVENTDKIFHLVLPNKPGIMELSDEALNAAAGGAACFCCAITGNP